MEVNLAGIYPPTPAIVEEGFAPNEAVWLGDDLDGHGPQEARHVAATRRREVDQHGPNRVLREDIRPRD